LAPLEQLELRYLKHGPVSSVAVSGRLVLGPPVDALKKTLDNLIDHGETNLVLDLGGVQRLDSSGIGLLVKALQTSKGRGGNVKLSSVPKVVAQTLGMCGLLPLFDVFGSEQEAIDSYA
jgi:anti-sigma B factor antagonist